MLLKTLSKLIRDQKVKEYNIEYTNRVMEDLNKLADEKQVYFGTNQEVKFVEGKKSYYENLKEFADQVYQKHFRK